MAITKRLTNAEMFATDDLFLTNINERRYTNDFSESPFEWLQSTRAKERNVVDERVDLVYIVQDGNMGGSYLRSFWFDREANDVYFTTTSTDFWESIDGFERMDFEKSEKYRWKMLRTCVEKV